MKAWLVFLLFFVGNLSAQAASTLTETFDTLTYRSSTTTATWNSALGIVVPPLQVVSYSTTQLATNDIDVGDGSDGPFDSSTYSNFGTVSANVITIDTDTRTELKVTSFVLNSGYTIRPTGSNPLIIRSLGDVTINGNIDCSGGDGADSVNTSSSPTGGSAGGTGRCGGRNGATGGSLTAPGNGSNAVSAAGYITAGQAGAGSSSGLGGSGGGGAGGFDATNSTPTSGVTGAGANAGNAGTSGPTATGLAFSDSFGGAGGGSGGACVTAHCPGNETTGAGGGAGGGAIYIYSGRDIIFGAAGTICANGGNGGAGTGATLHFGGGGGGGGGGTIVLLAARDFNNNGAAANITALGGAGGNKGRGGASNGGTGAWGRVWLSDSDATLGGTGTENPQTMYANNFNGTVKYRTGNYTAVSTAYDLQTTRPVFQSISASATLPGGSTLTLEVAGSRDGSTWTSYIGGSSISQLSGYRYLRFRATLYSNIAVTPAQIQSIAVIFDPGNVTDFDFTAACGRVGGGDLLVLVALASLIWFWHRRRSDLSPSRATAT